MSDLCEFDAIELPSYYSREVDEVKKYSKDDFIMLSYLDYEIKEIAETIEALTKSKFFKENHNAYLYDKSGIIGNQVYKVLDELKKLSYTVQDSWWQVIGDNDVMDLPISSDNNGDKSK